MTLHEGFLFVKTTSTYKIRGILAENPLPPLWIFKVLDVGKVPLPPLWIFKVLDVRELLSLVIRSKSFKNSFHQKLQMFDFE